MAIVKAITLDSGIELQDAYHKIHSVKYTLPVNDENLGDITPEEAKILVEFDVLIFVNKQSRDMVKQPVKKFKVISRNLTYFSLSALEAANVNLVSQCYEFLKTQVIEGIDYTVNTQNT